MVPIGRNQGVGAFNGWKLPTFAVKMAKGKDYMIGYRDGKWIRHRTMTCKRAWTNQELAGISHGTKWAKP